MTNYTTVSNRQFTDEPLNEFTLWLGTTAVWVRLNDRKDRVQLKCCPNQTLIQELHPSYPSIRRTLCIHNDDCMPTCWDEFQIHWQVWSNFRLFSTRQWRSGSDPVTSKWPMVQFLFQYFHITVTLRAHFRAYFEVLKYISTENWQFPWQLQGVIS